MNYSRNQISVCVGLFAFIIFVYWNFYYILALAVVSTLGLQAAAAYYLVKVKIKKAPEEIPSLSPVETQENSVNLRKDFGKRKTNIPCLCTTDNFKALCTGNEKMMNELLANLKELVANDKNFAVNLEKACEKTVIQRIQQKPTNYLEDLWKVLIKISRIYEDNSKDLDDTLLLGIKLMEKDTKKRHSKLAEKMKKAGETFCKEIENVQKLTGKVEKCKKNLSIAQSSQEKSKNKSANFEKSLEIESKIRILSNRLEKNRHLLEITRDNILKESKPYLAQVEALFGDLIEINKMKGESYRSHIQFYLTNIQNLWKESHLELEKLTLPGKSHTERLEIDSERLSTKRTSERSTEIKEAMSKLDKFIETYAQIEKSNMENFVYIFENWQLSHEIGLESANFEFLQAMDEIKKNLKEFQKGCEFIRGNIQSSLVIFNQTITGVSEIREDILDKQQIEIDEVKMLFLSILLSNLSEKCKIISLAARHFESIEEVKEMLQFFKDAEIHSYSCPYYKYKVNLVEASPNAFTNTEEALWLNNLLSVYVEEWKDSEKFQTYICRKLAKKLNKDNPDIIGNISVKNFQYEGPPPTVRDFASQTEQTTDFHYDFTVIVNGEASFTICVPLKFGVFNPQISAVIKVTDFIGKIRICYTSVGDDQSWYSLPEKPTLKLSVFPMIHGKFLDISHIPAVRHILNLALGKKLDNYIFPKKRSVKITKGRAKKAQYP